MRGNDSPYHFDSKLSYHEELTPLDESPVMLGSPESFDGVLEMLDELPETLELPELLGEPLEPPL